MLAIRIALRYLFSRKSHSAVNIISYVSIAGVALASAAMVIVLSVFNGFSAFTSQKLSRIDPDLLIVPAEGKIIENADSLARELLKLDFVANAAPVIREQAFAVADEMQMPLTVMGILPDSPTANAVNRILIDGVPMPSDTLADGLLPAISSIGVANTLRSTPGYPVRITVYEPKRHGRLNPASPMGAFRADSVIPVGVYRVDQPEYDADLLMIPLATARHLLQYTTEASAIEISLRRGQPAADAAAGIGTLLPPELIVKDRLAQQANALRMINVEKWVTLLMLIFILIIASFNILSTMSMLIVEKRPNRAILTAMGASSSAIASIFSWLSFLISSIGGILGIIVGLGLSLAQQYGGLIKLHANDMSAMAIDVYPVRVQSADLIAVAAVVIAIGLITSLIVKAVTRRG